MCRSSMGGDLVVVLQDIVFQALAVPAPVRTPVGPDEREDFQSTLTATANVTYLSVPSGPQAFSLSGPSMWVAANKVGNTTGVFDVELVEMSLIGNVIVPGLGPVPIQLRENVSEASMGKTEITDIGGGLYHIDSFFDVYAEVSPDGGQTWMAATESVHMVLVPEPMTLVLVVLGGLMTLTRRRK